MIKYDSFKLSVFRATQDGTRTIITYYLKLLSKDFNIPYNQVVDDFNEYNYHVWEIEYDR